jgi:hypothetical protein
MAHVGPQSHEKQTLILSPVVHAVVSILLLFNLCYLPELPLRLYESNISPTGLKDLLHVLILRIGSVRHTIVTLG